MKRLLSVVCIFSVLIAAVNPVCASENTYSMQQIAIETASEATMDIIEQIPIYITSTNGAETLTNVEKDVVCSFLQRGCC